MPTKSAFPVARPAFLCLLAFDVGKPTFVQSSVSTGRSLRAADEGILPPGGDYFRICRSFRSWHSFWRGVRCDHSHLQRPTRTMLRSTRRRDLRYTCEWEKQGASAMDDMKFTPLRGLFATFALLWLLGGCSPAEDRPAMELFAHPGSCRQCHGPSRGERPGGWKSPESPRDSLCATEACHPTVASSAAFLHGPVATGDCASCHLPHSSAQRHLLKRTERQLCFGCHQQLISCPAGGGSERSACTTCHDPHQGENRFLLVGTGHAATAHQVAR